MTETNARAIALTQRLAETGPSRLADVGEDMTSRQLRRIAERARDAGLVLHDGGGVWRVTSFGRRAAGRLGGF